MSQIFKQFTAHRGNLSNVGRRFSEESETDFAAVGSMDSLAGACHKKMGCQQSAEKQIRARASVGSQSSSVCSEDPTSCQDNSLFRGSCTSSRIKDQVTKASMVFLKTVGKVKMMTGPKKDPGDASDAKTGKATDKIDGVEKDLPIQQTDSRQKSYASASIPSVAGRSSVLLASSMKPLLPGDSSDRAGTVGPSRANSATMQQLMEDARRDGDTTWPDMIQEKVNAATLPLEKKIICLQASCAELLAAKDQLETLVFKAEQETKLERKNAEKHRLKAEQLQLTLDTLTATLNSPVHALQEPALPEGTGADDALLRPENGEQHKKSPFTCSQTPGVRRRTSLFLSPAVSAALQERTSAAAAPKAPARRLTRAGTMPLQQKASATAAASEAAKDDAKPGKQRQLSRLNSDVFANKPGLPLAKVVEAKSKPARKDKRASTCHPVDLGAVEEQAEADDAEEDRSAPGTSSVAAENADTPSVLASGTSANTEASDAQCPLAKAEKLEESMLLELEKPALQMRFKGSSSCKGALLETRDKCSVGMAKNAKVS